MIVKAAVFALLLAVCTFEATAKPSNTLGIPKERNPDPDRPVPLPGNAPCQEGKTWKNDCNDCVCTNGQAACTLKMCLGHKVQKRQVPVETHPAVCEEGKYWKDDCNDCNCRNGQPVCTYKLCLVHSVQKRQLTVPTTCEEGKAWKNECNDCVCTNGEAACTFKMCL